MNKNKDLDIEATFALAVQNHKSNNFQVAKDLYNQILEINPNHTDALNNLGSIYSKLDDNQKAISCYEKVIKINPNHTDTLNNLGSIYSKLDDNQKAKDYYEKVIKINPNIIDTHYNLGIIFEKLLEHQKAINCFEKVIEINPNHTRALINLGNVKFKSDDIQNAKVFFEKAIEINPTNAYIHNNLGLVYNKMEEYQKAKACYQKAIEIDSNYLDAYNNLGLIYNKLQEYQKAISCYEKAIEIKPNYANVHNNLGNVFKKLDEYQKAIDCFKKTIEIDPTNAGAHNNLGVIFKELEEDQKAIKCFEKAIEIDPKNVNSHNNLGIMYSKINKHDKSVEHLQESLINRSKINFETVEEKDRKLRPATNSFFLELTNKCNFHCEFCPSDSQTRLHGFMELSLVKKIFDEISQKKIVTTVNLHLMGEPTLHPKLNEILEYAKSKKINVSLTTNGSTLVKKRVPKLLDSISGKIVASLMTPTEETYEIRGDVGLSWDRYIDNFKLLVQEHLKKILRGDKIEYQILIRIMVSNENRKGTAKVLESSKGIQESYSEWCNFVEDMENELGLKNFARPKIDSDKAYNMIGEGSREVSFNLQNKVKIQFWRAFTFANTRVKDEYKLLPQEKTQYCPHPFKDFGVLWNGDVSLCCLDYDATLKVGNVRDHSVEDVLKSTKSNKLRASMHGLEKLHPTCVKCQSRPVER